jgi:hypothetical protein
VQTRIFFFTKNRGSIEKGKLIPDFSGIFFNCDRDRDLKILFCRDPVYKGVISPKTRPDGIVESSDFHRGENPCGNSGTTEPVMNPVVPHFPHPPYFRGHNSQNHRNRAGIIERSPAGTDEVVFSDVAAAERGRGCGLGCGEHLTGDMPTPLLDPH